MQEAVRSVVFEGDDWRGDVMTWCQDFRRFLVRPWRDREALEQFERIENLAALADVIADRPVADATAELTVFLCAFADSQIRPDVGQRRRLQRLVDALERSATRRPIGVPNPTPTPAVSEDALFRVVYVRTSTRHQNRLAHKMQHEQMDVHVVDSIEEAALALDHDMPDALVLDAEFVPQVRRLVQPFRPQGASMWRRVLVAATGVEHEVRTRLRARRDGVDLLLEGDTEAAVDALLHAITRRRDEAYRVLVVEDDRGHAAFCESLLRHQGFEVDVAGSAEAALLQIEKRTPDLVLLDIHLPGMDGIELAQLVRERHELAHVPLVFLTGEEDLDRRAEAIAVGGDDFLSKPVRPRHLLANVNGRIERARLLGPMAPAERPHSGLPQPLDRVRFLEAMERLRSENGGCAGVVVYALDDVARVANELGFVGTGSVALQLSQWLEAECGGLGHTCALGGFAHLALVLDPTEIGLGMRAESVRRRLSEHAWTAPSGALRFGFSAGLVRFDATPADRDAVVAEAVAMLEHAQREGGRRLRYHHLT